MQSISASKNTNHGRKLSLPPTLSTSSRQIQNPPTIPNWIGLRTMAQATFLCLNFNSVHKRTEISRKNIMTKHLWNHCRNTTLLQMARCDQDVRWSEPSTRLVMTRGRDAKLLTMTMKRTFVGVCAPSFSKIDVSGWNRWRKTLKLLITFDKLILHLITFSRDIHGFHPEEFVKAHADLHEGLWQRGQFLQSLPIPSLLKVKQSDFERKN